MLFSLCTNGIVANNGTHGGTIPIADINAGAGSVLDELLADQPTGTSQPKAFLNWMIVDEEFKKVSSSFHMGAVQVPSINSTTMQKQPLIGPTNMTVRRNGWLYVYISNESNQDVYFDDLIINHKRGPVVDVNNYYAFGLQIAGISSKALAFGGAENKYKYNGKELQSKEFSDGSGLELYDATNRIYDPQIGRFFQLDELGEVALSWSPYSFSFDNPVSFNDPLGLEAEVPGEVKEKRKHGFTPDDPNVLNTVTVRGKHSTKNLINSYWFYRLHGGGLTMAPPEIQNWLYRYDVTEQWLEKLHKSQREDDALIAEYLTYLLPIGEIRVIGKLAPWAMKLLNLRRGGRVFYSGSTAARILAENYAKMFGGHTLSMTLKGKFLGVLSKYMPGEFTEKLIQKSSESFAKGAEGEIRFFTTETGPTIGGHWEVSEKPNLDKIIKIFTGHEY